MEDLNSNKEKEDWTEKRARNLVTKSGACDESYEIMWAYGFLIVMEWQDPWADGSEKTDTSSFGKFWLVN